MQTHAMPCHVTEATVEPVSVNAPSKATSTKVTADSCANRPSTSNLIAVEARGGTISEIVMRYVSRYLSHDTICITILH